jgi:hypothetical protein
VDIQGIGGLFGLPFKEVYEYLKGVKETREVEAQLGRVSTVAQYVQGGHESL